MQIDVEFVDNVQMVRTGKRLASVSKLPVDFQSNAPAQVPGVRGGAPQSRGTPN